MNLSDIKVMLPSMCDINVPPEFKSRIEIELGGVTVTAYNGKQSKYSRDAKIEFMSCDAERIIVYLFNKSIPVKMSFSNKHNWNKDVVTISYIDRETYAVYIGHEPLTDYEKTRIDDEKIYTLI